MSQYDVRKGEGWAPTRAVISHRSTTAGTAIRLTAGPTGRKLDFSDVFRISAKDGTVSLVSKSLNPNGICLSPDLKKLHVTNGGSWWVLAGGRIYIRGAGEPPAVLQASRLHYGKSSNLFLIARRAGGRQPRVLASGRKPPV